MDEVAACEDAAVVLNAVKAWTRNVLEQILAPEESHAEEMASMLAPRTASGAQT